MSWIKLEKRNALRHTVAGRIPLCSRSRAKQQKCSVRLRAGPCAGKAALLWAGMQRWTCGVQGLPLPKVRGEKLAGSQDGMTA